MLTCTTTTLCWVYLVIGCAVIRESSAIHMEGTPKKDDPTHNNRFLGKELGDRDLNRERDLETTSCRKEFRKVPGHTMCLQDQPGAISTGVTREEQQLILKLHNDVRAMVQPPASNMQRMIWDDRLAEVAQKWARVCGLKHDKERGIPGFRASVGQNLASSTARMGWRKAVSLWSDEVKDFTFGRGRTGPGATGHYTQMVKALSSRVGCGYAVCPNLSYNHRYVCNYSPGQLISDLKIPYTPGSRCWDCGEFCRDGLCDCGGLVCENHSNMNASICACACHKRFSGRDCATVKCELDDNPAFCAHTDVNACKRFYNVPQECPHMCGLCRESRPPTRRPAPSTTPADIPPPLTHAPNETEECSDPESCGTDHLFITGGVTKSDRSLILEVHNGLSADFKDFLSRKLPKMKWDKRLSTKAQTWAEQCQPSADPSLHDSGDNDGIEQMRGLGYRTWSKTLEKWISEEQLLTIIKDGNDRIGCGFALCNHRRKRFYFCNYRVSGIDNSTGPGDNEVTGGKNVTETTPTESPDCPADMKFCGVFSFSNCSLFPVLPYLCPHLCGRCNVTR